MKKPVVCGLLCVGVVGVAIYLLRGMLTNFVDVTVQPTHQVELEDLAREQWHLSNPLREECNQAIEQHDLCKVLALEDEIARIANEYARRRQEVVHHGKAGPSSR